MTAGTGRSVVVGCPSCGRRNRRPVAGSGRARCAQCSADLPWLVDAGDPDWAEVVEQSRLPVLVDVWAPWCGPCRRVAPVVEQLARERAGRLKVVTVNADESPGVSARLGVRSIPTLALVVDGRVTARVVGAQPADALRNWLDGALSGS
jgi:thioredoxin 2